MIINIVTIQKSVCQEAWYLIIRGMFNEISSFGTQCLLFESIFIRRRTTKIQWLPLRLVGLTPLKSVKRSHFLGWICRQMIQLQHISLFFQAINSLPTLLQAVKLRRRLRNLTFGDKRLAPPPWSMAQAWLAPRLQQVQPSHRLVYWGLLQVHPLTMYWHLVRMDTSKKLY